MAAPDATAGIGGGYIRDSLISQNTLQSVDQGIGFLYYARNNKISGNRGSGFKRMAVELLGNREPATASANLYGNSVTNNVFSNWIRDPLVDADPATLTEVQNNWAGGMLSGISIAKGVNTTISGNTVICGAACTVRAAAGNALGDLNGMGIEAAGVNTAVSAAMAMKRDLRTDMKHSRRCCSCCAAWLPKRCARATRRS